MSQRSVADRTLAHRLEALVAVPSITGNESAAVDLCRVWLEEIGPDQVHRWDEQMSVLADDPDYPGREVERQIVPVVAARLIGNKPGPKVTLTGHVDTVPPGEGWTSDPHQPRLDGDRLFGLGACDMKGGVVAAIAAFAAFAEAGRGFAGELEIVLVPGEEDGGTGTLSAIRRGWGGDLVIITEPTSRDGNPQIVVAHGGALTFTIEVAGRSAHASIAPEGENALNHFGVVQKALSAIEAELNAAEDNELMRALGTPYATNIGKISGGVWSASVMDRIVAEVRMGVALSETIAQAEARVFAGVMSAAAGDPWLATHPPKVSRTGAAFGSSAIDPEHLLVSTLAAAAASTTGVHPTNIGVPYGCDMALWKRVGNSTPLVYGPGDIRQAHAPNEWVAISEVEAVARVLVRACSDLLAASIF